MTIKINKQEFKDLEKNLKEQIENQHDYNPIEQFFDSLYPEHKQTPELIQLDNLIDGVSREKLIQIAKIIKYQMMAYMREIASSLLLDEFFDACYNVLDINFEITNNEPTHGVCDFEFDSIPSIYTTDCPGCGELLVSWSPLCRCGFRVDRKER